MIRLLIVEDQPGVRIGLHMLLDAETDLFVVGEASDADTALDLATALGPDVVLMDVEMQCMDAIAATSALRLIRPQTAVIILSLYDDALTRVRAHDAGASAFVTKCMPVDILLTTIRQVADQSATGLILPPCQARSQEVE